VIRRLEIRGLVVIERAELEPAAGLTAITGETGAGKTVVAQALSLLVGGQADARAVRPGARHALVEATLGLPSGFWDDLDPADAAAGLRELVDDESEVVVAQRVPAEGRARALLDGQTVTRAAAGAVAGRLIRFSSQHEGRRLVASSTQLAVLDAFAGADAVDLARRLAASRRRLSGLARALATARERRDAAERERAALEDLVAAVDAAGIGLEEEQDLRAERGRLVHADRLAQAALSAVEALSPDAGDGGAVQLAGEAARALSAVIEVDEALRPPWQDLRAVEATIQDIASTLRSYVASLDAEPHRLAEVEERLTVYDRLSRRYGPGTKEVLDRADQARTSLAELEVGADADAQLAGEHAATLAQARELAGELREVRREAAPRLEEAVAAELAELAMPAAAVRVEIVEDPGDPPTDRAVLWLRANPGLPEAPLADVASGGELSRVLLALHGVAAAADPDVTWVFDEVDSGVGGVTATAVAAKLEALARARQVIVITHLPQVAALAERHYRLVKGVDADGRATTRIDAVEGDDLIDELCRMLGAAPTDGGARTHARELLARRDGDRPKRRARRAASQST
jgi:DNA repair protein RecN (Recombination protein N)